MMRKVSAALLALILLPALAFAAVMEGTVVNVDRNRGQILVETEQGQKILQIAGNTKGIEHAVKGAKIKVEYSNKDGQLVAEEISSDRAGDPSAPAGKEK